jgi:hypothetical protein
MGRQAGNPTKGTHREDLNNLLKGLKSLNISIASL